MGMRFLGIIDYRMHVSDETEEEFSTRLVNNLEDLILKEGPETVININVFFSCGKSFCN